MSDNKETNLSMDAFGIKAIVEGGIELIKARFMPIMSAKGDARARLIELRGEFEFEKEKYRLSVLEKAENKLYERGILPRPIDLVTLIPFLDAASLVTDNLLQDLWAELLCGNVTKNISNQRMGIYQHVLSQFTACDAMLLKYIVDSNLQYSNGSFPDIWVTVSLKEEYLEIEGLHPAPMKRKSQQFPFTDRIYQKEIEFTVPNLSRIGIVTPASEIIWSHSSEWNACGFRFTAFGLELLRALHLIVVSNNLGTE